LKRAISQATLVLLVFCTLVSVSDVQSRKPAPVSVEAANNQSVWWFDYKTMSVCYRVDLAKRSFRVDFDGDHSTTTIDTYSNWDINYGACADLGVTRNIRNGTGAVYAWAFRIGEKKIDGPAAHINGADWWETEFHVNRTEWFYYWVNWTTPPTDWVVHVQRSNGTNPSLVTDTFWYSQDCGKTWNSFTPILSISVIICPRTLNLRSQGKWVLAFIIFSEQVDTRHVDSSFPIMLNGSVAEVGHFGMGRLVIVKFNRRQLDAYILSTLAMKKKATTVNLVLTGKLNDGTIFQGTDLIRVVVSKKNRPII